MSGAAFFAFFVERGRFVAAPFLAFAFAALMKRSGRTVTREALVNAVYNFDEEIQSNSLDAHVSRLRKKLAGLNAGVAIHTIRGIGYLLKVAE